MRPSAAIIGPVEWEGVERKKGHVRLRPPAAGGGPLRRDPEPDASGLDALKRWVSPQTALNLDRHKITPCVDCCSLSFVFDVSSPAGIGFLFLLATVRVHVEWSKSDNAENGEWNTSPATASGVLNSFAQKRTRDDCCRRDVW